MKALEWRKYLDNQHKAHGKALFTVAELANVAGVSLKVLNVELSRLRRQGVVVQYAQGQYGLPDVVSPEELLGAMDCHAYITGAYALQHYSLITQVQARVTCFTDRRVFRKGERQTPVGLFDFVCVRNLVYAPPSKGIMAAPAQALCDFIYVTRRSGALVRGLVTFRNLTASLMSEVQSILDRYPDSVRREAESLGKLQ